MARMINVKILGSNPCHQEEFQALLNGMLEMSAADELLSENWVFNCIRGEKFHFVANSDTSLAYAALPDIYGGYDIIELMNCDGCEIYYRDSEVGYDEISDKQLCSSCLCDIKESRREQEDAQWKQDSERNS